MEVFLPLEYGVSFPTYGGNYSIVGINIRLVHTVDISQPIMADAQSVLTNNDTFVIKVSYVSRKYTNLEEKFVKNDCH